MAQPSGADTVDTANIDADLTIHFNPESLSAEKAVKDVTIDDAVVANVRMSQLSDKTNSSLDTKEVGLEPIEQTWKPKTSELMIMLTMAVSSLIVALDTAILVPVLPTLAVELHGTSAEAFWTGTSYLLAHSVLQPTIASLSDIFGRRELLVPSILCFASGSVACGVAHNFKVMLVGRVIQGIGGAGIITLSQLIFADLVPLRFRPKYFTMVLGAWALGSVLGPLIGGLFVEKATWRWCFYLNLPVCGTALPMAAWFLRSLTAPKTDLITKIRAVDWTGNTLFVLSLTSLLISISWAGIQFEWKDYQTIAPLVIGGVGVLVTILHQARVAKKPFLIKQIFHNTSVVASCICALLQGLALYMAVYYVAFYFTAAQFYGPIRTGCSLLPATVSMMPGSAITNSLITRYGWFRPFIWAGFAIGTLSCGLFILWNDKTPIPIWAVCECLFGVGIGMVISAVNVSIQAAVEPEHAGQAAAMYAFMRSVGMAVGVAVGGTVFQNVMKHKLIDLNVPQAAELAKNAEGYIEELKQMSTTGGVGVMRNKITLGYVHGFRGVFITMTAMCAAGLLVSAFIKQGNLNRQLKSMYTVRRPI